MKSECNNMHGERIKIGKVVKYTTNYTAVLAVFVMVF